MKTITKILPLAMIVALTMSVASGVMADPKWEKEHPHRDQVNDRLANQNKRIHQ